MPSSMFDQSRSEIRMTVCKSRCRGGGVSKGGDWASDCREINKCSCWSSGHPPLRVEGTELECRRYLGSVSAEAGGLVDGGATAKLDGLGAVYGADDSVPSTERACTGMAGSEAADADVCGRESPLAGSNFSQHLVWIGTPEHGKLPHRPVSVVIVSAGSGGDDAGGSVVQSQGALTYGELKAGGPASPAIPTCARLASSSDDFAKNKLTLSSTYLPTSAALTSPFERCSEGRCCLRLVEKGCRLEPHVRPHCPRGCPGLGALRHPLRGGNGNENVPRRHIDIRYCEAHSFSRERKVKCLVECAASKWHLQGLVARLRGDTH
eukprot:1194061-Prorocentrum_minimum.AAC.2